MCICSIFLHTIMLFLVRLLYHMVQIFNVENISLSLVQLRHSANFSTA